jgi:hypothetical protein
VRQQLVHHRTLQQVLLDVWSVIISADFKLQSFIDAIDQPLFLGYISSFARRPCMHVTARGDVCQRLTCCMALSFRCPPTPAAWLSKYAGLLNQLQLTIRDSEKLDREDQEQALSRDQVAAAEQAIAAALQQAAAGAAPNQSRGLHITSCKLEYGQAGSAAILQALAGNALTSLVYNITLPDDMPDADATAAFSRVSEALQGLQQLRTLGLDSHLDCGEAVCVGPALFGCSSLSQLTRVELDKVGKHAAASCIAPAPERPAKVRKCNANAWTALLQPAGWACM